MGRLEKYLGQGTEIEVGEDIFKLKPLDVDFLPHFFKAMKAFSGAKEGATTAELLSNIDDSGLNSIKVIIDETLRRSMPEEPEDLRKQFGLKYMGVLLGKIFEMNSAGDVDPRQKRHLDKVQALKEKQSNGQSSE